MHWKNCGNGHFLSIPHFKICLKFGKFKFARLRNFTPSYPIVLHRTVVNPPVFEGEMEEMAVGWYGRVFPQNSMKLVVAVIRIGVYPFSHCLIAEFAASPRGKVPHENIAEH
jgi:hypothetical protein